MTLVSCTNQDTKTANVAPVSIPEHTVSESDMLPANIAGELEKSPLSEQEKNSLIQMREEEKLAHDVRSIYIACPPETLRYARGTMKCITPRCTHRLSNNRGPRYI